MRRLASVLCMGLAIGMSGCTDASSSASSVRGEPTPVVKSEPQASPLATSTIHTVPARPSVLPVFRDVASELGIDFTFYSDTVPERFFLPEVMGGGIAWFDFDLDGWPDMFVRDGCELAQAGSGRDTVHFSRMYRNVLGRKFVDVSMASRGDWHGYGQGCAVGDFNADGFGDLCVTDFGNTTLLRNNGDGTFSDVTPESGITNRVWATSAVWFDVDDDGDLDLYVANYMDVTFAKHKVCEYSGKPGYCGPGNYDSLPDRLFENQGDGTFVESSQRLGLLDSNGNGLAVIAVDFDNDLKPEIYVANDMNPNYLFSRTRMSGDFDAEATRYMDVASIVGCAVSGAGINEASMGIAVADFDQNGLPDIFVTNYFHAKNTLYRNRGNLVFDDDSYRTQIAATSFESLGFGTCALDFNRDGDMDLFVANGHVLGPLFRISKMRPQLIQNQRGRFTDVSSFAGAYFESLRLGRGVAAGDFDNDGNIDIAVSHIDSAMVLLRNETQTKRHYIGFELTTTNRAPPVGGRVVVASGDLRQVRPISAGGSYLSYSDTRLVFGLADTESPIKVEVFWPSGRIDRFEGLEQDRYWRIVEGQSPEPQPIPNSQ